MSLKLITHSKKFRPLFWTQFCGALNDNLLKNALVVLVTFKGISLWGLASQSLVALSGAIFILPFFLFSTVAGSWADGFQRRKIIRGVKLAEIAIMILAAFGFLSDHHGLLFFSLFLMGIHSTFFGPVKYSMIPDLVEADQIVAGNAMIEVGTFLAILIGTIGGGILVSLPQGQTILVAALLAVALIGLFFGYQVPTTPIAQASLKWSMNPFPEIMKIARELRPQTAVWNSIMGISWFWFFGAALMSLIPVFTKDVLHGSEEVVTFFLAVFTIGIATGSVLCEKLSFGQVEIGIVPLGSLGMTVFLVDLAFASHGYATVTGAQLLEKLSSLSEFLAGPNSHRIAIDLFMISIFGGIFTVPLYSLIQTRSQSSHRSRVIGMNNILNAVFMVVSAVLIVAFHSVGWGPLKMFLFFAGLNLIAAFYIYSIVPEFTLRFLAWMIAHVLYRIHPSGEHNIPKQGPALLVCNHVTFIDWLFISAVVKRPVRFVMYYKFANNLFTKYLVKHGKIILIAGQKENPNIFEKAFRQISEELKAGELVCLFPEGTITHTGEIGEIKGGYQHILQADPVPLIPMTLNNLWGSLFSRYDKSLSQKRPRKLWQRISLHMGEAEYSNYSSPNDLQKKLKDLLI